MRKTVLQKTQMRRRTIEQLKATRSRLGPVGALDFLIDFEENRRTSVGSYKNGVNRWIGGVADVQRHHADAPTVSVIMTTFNSARTVKESILSVLNQTFKDLELLVVDDFSSDGTIDIIRQLAEKDRRLRLIRCFTNRGTYWAKNLGILHSRGNLIALHDSDDVSHPERIDVQRRGLDASDAYICYTNWVRTDRNGNPVENRGLIQRLGYPTAMFRKSLIDKLGFFDGVRIAADDEFDKRIKLVLGKNAVLHIKKPLYTARLNEDSLTGRSPVLMYLPDKNDPLSFLSDTRRKYVDCYKRWHQSGSKLVMPFPLKKRLFDAPESMVTESINPNEKVVASVASIPRRVKGLERVVNSALDNVDLLRVHLNHYESVPNFLRHPKITVTRSQDTGDLRDNGKFLAVEELTNCFHFTLDDDLCYPAFYFQYLIAKILQYGKNAVVGLHGTTLSSEFQRYHDTGSRKTKTFNLQSLHDFQVHVLGTGTVAYHTETIDFSLEHVNTTGMIDLWFAAAAKTQRVPLICVARGKDWLIEDRSLTVQSLYSEYRKNDQMQTEFVLSKGLNEPLDLVGGYLQNAEQ